MKSNGEEEVESSKATYPMAQRRQWLEMKKKHKDKKENEGLENKGNMKA